MAQPDVVALVCSTLVFIHFGVFQDLGVFHSPEAEAQEALNYNIEQEHALPAWNSFGILPKSYFDKKT